MGCKAKVKQHFQCALHTLTQQLHAASCLSTSCRFLGDHIGCILSAAPRIIENFVCTVMEVDTEASFWYVYSCSIPQTPAPFCVSSMVVIVALCVHSCIHIHILLMLSLQKSFRRGTQ
jgi:hypothetical protein